MDLRQPQALAARARSRSLAEAVAWIDAAVAPLPQETAGLAELCGRVLAADIAALAAEPPHARAVSDGVAVCADELVGASAYNPLTFRLAPAREALAPGTAVAVNAGDPLPRGADAVVPPDYVHTADARGCEIVEAVAPGHAVEMAGSHIRRGATVFAAGRQLSAADIGILAQLGIASAAVVRRPSIGIVLIGRGLDSGTRDADGPMLQRLIARDGGVAGQRHVARDPAALRAALAGVDLDAVFVVGGTGRGPDDRSAAVLAELGEVAVGEIALDPGSGAALGRIAPRTLVGLLPGRPAACLWAYELVMGRAVRRLGGRDPALPYATRTLTLARKIVSAIGVTEIWPVRLAEAEQVEPVTAAPRDSLLALTGADGFIVVPEASEGLAAGATAQVYVHGSGA